MEKIIKYKNTWNSPIQRELWDKKRIFASFKIFWWKKWKSKSLTNSRHFYPDPPQSWKIRVVSFLEKLDHSDHLYDFLGGKKIEKNDGNWLDPPILENSITFDLIIYWNLPLADYKRFYETITQSIFQTCHILNIIWKHHFR